VENIGILVFYTKYQHPVQTVTLNAIMLKIGCKISGLKVYSGQKNELAITTLAL